MSVPLNIKPDRYAFVNYCSEVYDNEDASYDGDADDNHSFTSARERVKVDVEFVVSSTIDRARYSFDRLLRNCDSDDASASSAELLSVASHDPSSDDDDDDLSYASSQSLQGRRSDRAVLEESSLGKPSITSESLGNISVRDTFSVRRPERPQQYNHSHSHDNIYQDSSSDPPALDELTVTSAFCSNQDCSVSSSATTHCKISTIQDIDNSIETIREIKARLQSLKRFSVHYSSQHEHNQEFETSRKHYNIAQKKFFNNSAQSVSSRSANNGVAKEMLGKNISPISTAQSLENASDRVKEIKSRLRHLEKFSHRKRPLLKENLKTDGQVVNGYTGMGMGQGRELNQNTYKRQLQENELNGVSDSCSNSRYPNKNAVTSIIPYKDDLKTTIIDRIRQQNQNRTNCSSSSFNVLTEYEAAMLRASDDMIEAVLKLSREVLMFLFALFTIYILYLTKRDKDLNSLQLEMQQMKMFVRAITIAHEKQWSKVAMAKRIRGPLRRFFFKS